MSEDKAGWLALWRSLVARGLTGVVLVIADAHQGLVEAIGETLPGVTWQRCRTHYLGDLLATVAKSQAALELRPWYVPSSTSPTPTRWRLSSNEWSRRSQPSCPRLLDTSKRPARICLPSGTSASELWRQISRTNPQGALEQGDPSAHRRSGDLPGSSCQHPPHRLAAHRAAPRSGPMSVAP